MAHPQIGLPGQRGRGDQAHTHWDDMAKLLSHLLLLPAKSDLEPFLRDCLGMHERAYPPRVMRAYREQIEKRPKNVSFSEDNGY